MNQIAFNSSRLWLNAVQAGMVMAEAQSVIAMRLWGMAGLWSVPKGENTRMVREKTTAFSKSITAASLAAARGAPPETIVAAALKPIRKKTRANHRRLTRRGPKGS